MGESAWYLFKSVTFETLIFEGALLYILIQRIGAAKAILVSGFAFGIYHWFSWNLFGQPAAMAIVFVTTGLAGWLWALAFRVTGSIYLPFALHYGVNFASSILFSKDKSIGVQMFDRHFEQDPYTPGVILSVLLIACYYIGFPLLTWLYLRKRGKEKPGVTPQAITATN